MTITIFIPHEEREKNSKNILIDRIHQNRIIPISKNLFIIYQFFLQGLDSSTSDHKQTNNNYLIRFTFKRIWFEKQKKRRGNLLLNF